MTHPTPLRFVPFKRVAIRDASPGFGVLLRELRELRRMSQSELGRRAGSDHSTISRWESGDRNPTPESLSRLAGAMKLSEHDRDALMVAAGYVPSDPMHILASEPVIGRLASLLSDPTIPAEVRDGVREMLWQVVRIVPRGEAVAS